MLWIRTYRLAAQSLWFDELSTWWNVTQTSWLEIFTSLWQPQAGYPLYHLILKGWITLWGDNEWALRSLSAITGVLAIVLITQAAQILGRSPKLCWVLMFVAPFPIWYGQEATAYSLLLCAAALVIWVLVRMLQQPTLKHAGELGLALLVCMSIHRLGMLLMSGCLLAMLLHWAPARLTFSSWRVRFWVIGWIGLGLFFGMVVGYSVYAVGVDNPLIAGVHRRADVSTALWMTLWSFSLNHNPGDVSWLWLIPHVSLCLYGIIHMLITSLHDWRARTLLCMALAPTFLFMAQLWWTKVYEPRYLIIQYPVWVLLLAAPVSLQTRIQTVHQQRWVPKRWIYIVHRATVSCTVIVSLGMLLMPRTGLWSGHPVREQYREAVRHVSRQIHPNDSLMVHPGYLALAWFYYAPRVSPDPLPHPLTFTLVQATTTPADVIAHQISSPTQLRSWLLIGPFHARSIDPPYDAAPYGLVGSFYQHPPADFHACPSRTFLGVDALCIANQDLYATHSSTMPEIKTTISFGEELVLRGYTLKPFAGKFNAGGILPVTLFWEYLEPVATPYHFMLTLRRVGTYEPQALELGPFASGNPLPLIKQNQPLLIDQRAIPLRSYTTDQPLPIGKYELLLSVYHPDIGPSHGKVPALDFGGRSTTEVLLTTIDVSPGAVKP